LKYFVLILVILFCLKTNINPQVLFNPSSISLNEIKLLPSTDIRDFGRSVSIDDNYAIVGATHAAFIFKKNDNNWMEEYKLVGESNPQGSTLPPDFGYSVDISGEYAIVGAPFQVILPVLNNIGAAFIFKRNGVVWDLQEKIAPPVAHAFGLFGWSVAISSSYAVVGEANNNSAHIYKRTGENWHLDSTISNGYRYGEAVAISENIIAIGTVGGGILSEGQGVAFIYLNQNEEWIQQTKLQASDGLDIDGFGETLSITSANLLVGDAKTINSDSISTGAAYIFNLEDSNGVEYQKITASDGALGDLFGKSVSISDNFAIISAPEDQDYGIKSGSAYIFSYNGVTWIEEQKLLASDGAAYDNFGIATSISGNNIIIGASGNDDNGNNAGSAYIYSDFTTHIDDSRLLGYNSFILYQNYPNPFNPSTIINYSIPNQSNVILKVYNTLGSEIMTLVSKQQPQGYYKIEFNGSELTSGIYFYRLQSGKYAETKKMIILK
jgi:FG-GAP repeat/Secretion system C-terminal sorting domain